MFNHLDWDGRFQIQPGLNDAASLGVRIEAVAHARYKCIGVHHLTPTENRSNHHVYLGVLDENGMRIPNALIEWTWEGRAEPPLRVTLDKPDAEPAGNIPLSMPMTVSIWSPDGVSDRVVNLHTRHKDDPAPGGEMWNTLGHHSFYVVFQRKGIGPEPTPEPTPIPNEMLYEAVLAIYKKVESVQADLVTLLESVGGTV